MSQDPEVGGCMHEVFVRDHGVLTCVDCGEVNDEDFEDEDTNEDGLLSNCGMGEDGQCMFAGSEECDECPLMNEDKDDS